MLQKLLQKYTLKQKYFSPSLIYLELPMEINFKANLINKPNIKKLCPTTNEFVSHKVSFVEINPRLKDDIKALKNMSKLWDKDSIFASTIYYYAKKDPRKRTFLITEQADKFEKLEPEKILGITQLSKEVAGEHSIEYLETKPELQCCNIKRNYKKIGSCILDNLKEVFQNKTLKVDYIFDRVDFYLQNGFYFRDEVLGDLIWNANKK